MRAGRRAFLTAIALGGPISRATPRAQSIALDDFLVLSSRLTGHTNLDRGAGAVFLENLLAAPRNAARLMRPDPALEEEIILAWYTGVQAMDGENRVVTYSAALQWRTLGMAAPGTCVGRFGTWSKPAGLPGR